MADDETLDGRVVWITGGGTGIGRAMALEFARRGASVAVSGRRAERLAQTVAACEALGAPAFAAPCDVCEPEGVSATVAAVVEHFGRLDVAIANAGESYGGTIAELDAETWRAQLEVNVVGVAMTCRAALPHLRATEGRVAITCSVSGLMVSPGMGAFHASKYAVRALGQTLALELELEGSGVTCTLLHPGFVRKEDEVEGLRPAALLAEPEDVAPGMVDAVLERRLEVVFTRHGQVGAFLGMHAPNITHHAVSWASRHLAPKPPET